MSQVNKTGNQSNDKAKTAGAPNGGKSGGKPLEPMLKPRPQTLPMKK